MPARSNWKRDLWRKADKSGGELACWLWTASTRDGGRSHQYGKHHDENGRAQRAHRLAYELVHGPIPEGLVVMHTCDTPRCINPGHLTLGTIRENTWDAIEKGRMPFTIGRCRNGHDYTPENTITRHTGQKHCKTCQKAAMDRWVAANPDTWRECRRRAARRQWQKQKAKQAAQKAA